MIQFLTDEDFNGRIIRGLFLTSMSLTVLTLDIVISAMSMQVRNDVAPQKLCVK